MAPTNPMVDLFTTISAARPDSPPRPAHHLSELRLSPGFATRDHVSFQDVLWRAPGGRRYCRQINIPTATGSETDLKGLPTAPSQATSARLALSFSDGIA